MSRVEMSKSRNVEMSNCWWVDVSKSRCVEQEQPVPCPKDCHCSAFSVSGNGDNTTFLVGSVVDLTISVREYFGRWDINQVIPTRRSHILCICILLHVGITLWYIFPRPTIVWGCCTSLKTTITFSSLMYARKGTQCALGEEGSSF